MSHERRSLWRLRVILPYIRGAWWTRKTINLRDRPSIKRDLYQSRAEQALADYYSAKYVKPPTMPNLLTMTSEEYALALLQLTEYP